MEILTAYTLAVSGGDVTTMTNQLIKMDNRLMTNKYIHPVYEPKKGDLVFFTDGNIGIMIDDFECIYYDRKGNYLSKTEVVMDKETATKIKMFGRVNTTKRSKTVLKQHLNHFARYTQVRSMIIEGANHHNVPVDVVRTLIYNESKFNNKAVSWTGVTGISMFTQDTAKQFNVDKGSIRSQLFGTSKVLRYNFDRLPNYYSEEERWKLSALIYNRGKGIYFTAKKEMIKRGIPLTYDNMLAQINRYKYGKEGYQYVRKLDKYSYMFT